MPGADDGLVLGGVEARDRRERRQGAQPLGQGFVFRRSEKQREGFAVLVEAGAQKVAFKQLPQERKRGVNEFVVSHPGSSRGVSGRSQEARRRIEAWQSSPG